MESKLIDCCLLTSAFKINHEFILENASKVSFRRVNKSDSDSDFISIQNECFKFLIQGSQEQIKITLNTFKAVNRLCEKCVNYQNNLKEEFRKEMESLILAQQIQEKLVGRDKGGKHE